MIGWVGALAVVAGGIGVGRLLTQPARDRLEAISDWQHCLERLQVEVDWRRRPLGEALLAATRDLPAIKPVAGWLNQVLAEPGMDLGQATGLALQRDPRLQPEELRLLEQLLQQLGGSGGHYHQALWDWAREELRGIRTRVQEKARTEGRMLETLCTLAACALAIWLV